MSKDALIDNDRSQPRLCSLPPLLLLLILIEQRQPVVVAARNLARVCS